MATKNWLFLHTNADIYFNGSYTHTDMLKVFMHINRSCCTLEQRFGFGQVCSALLCWCHSRSNMEKSSYCCCYSHGRFNTGERNFHLSTPHSSPDTEHHTSPVQAEVKLNYSLLQKTRTTQQGSVFREQFLYPNQTSNTRRYSWNLKMSFLNYLQQKHQNVTQHEESGG